VKPASGNGKPDPRIHSFHNPPPRPLIEKKTGRISEQAIELKETEPVEHTGDVE
jgi:hypothetical protein